MDYPQSTRVSVIIPCYNSENTVVEVASRCAQAVSDMGYVPEIIMVNDCSTDDTLDRIVSLAKNREWATAIDFAKNYGQHNALLAGMRYSSGELVVGIDDDLQSQPEDMVRLLNQLDHSCDVVFGIPDRSQYQAYRTLGSRFNTWCARFLTDRPKDVRTSSYWAAKRFVVNASCIQRNYIPQIQSSFFEATKNVGNVVVRHNAREYGSSGYTLKSLVRQWGRLLTYSSKPFEIYALFSFSFVPMMLLALILSLALGLNGLSIAVIGVSLAALLMGTSLEGIYISRALHMLRGKPNYVVRAVYSMEQEEVVGNA